MSKIDISPPLPSSNQPGIVGKYKYGPWGYDLEEYSALKRVYIGLSFRIGTHVLLCRAAIVCIDSMFTFFRYAVKKEDKERFEKKLGFYSDLTEKEIMRYQRAIAVCRPYPANPGPSKTLYLGIQETYRHLQVLADRVNYGNRVSKSYASEDGGVAGNLFE